MLLLLLSSFFLCSAATRWCACLFVNSVRSPLPLTNLRAVPAGSRTTWCPARLALTLQGSPTQPSSTHRSNMSLCMKRTSCTCKLQTHMHAYTLANTLGLQLPAMTHFQVFLKQPQQQLCVVAPLMGADKELCPTALLITGLCLIRLRRRQQAPPA